MSRSQVPPFLTPVTPVSGEWFYPEGAPKA